MPQTRQIGLSLGADICWPACFEEILTQLKLDIPVNGDRLRFETERVTIEPYNLQKPVKYDMVLDRISHWFPMTREWVKKIMVMDGVYVLNNPWTIQSAEKHTTYAAMMRLGFPVPETAILPAKEYKDEWDNLVTMRRYGKLFSLEKAGDSVGWPHFIKPYDGGAWRGVTRVKDPAALQAAYNDSGTQIMHLQKAVDPYDIFVRGLGIGPQVNIMKYNPTAPLHARYEVAFNFLDAEGWRTMTRYTRVINAFFCWDYNSCEALRQDGILHPIDFANACPDSQVTSLHFHFPWVVKSLLRWSLFCAAYKRKPNLNPNWAPYLAIADEDISFPEKLEKYDALARAHFDSDRFEEFSETHLKHLDEVAWEFFGTERCREIFREKVAALFPKHEIDEFTDHYFGLVQFWRKTEAERVGRAS